MSRTVVGEVVVAALTALRCIPEGEVVSGCTTYDGNQVRETLRRAVLELRAQDSATGPTVEVPRGHATTVAASYCHAVCDQRGERGHDPACLIPLLSR